MVLRKERIPSTGNPSARNMSNNEQPVTKRQRIDSRNVSETSQSQSPITTNSGGTSSPASSSSSSLSSLSLPKDDHDTTPPDILVCPSTSSSSASSLSSSTSPSSSTSAVGVILNESHVNDTDEVDKVNQEIPDLLRLNNLTSASSISCSNEMGEFEEYLIKQCLCGVSERTLRKPFQSHYHHDLNGTKRIANLSEWPTDKLLQFLSNIQLLFDIYLKQNSKGFICSRIMDVCDALVRNDHNLIDEIIELGSFNNKYVQFLSGRVLASFLVVAKNNMDDNWLKKLVDNLFLFEHLDYYAVRKIHFSLEIIKRIVEWKDIDVHPLEEEGDSRSASISEQQPSLENNYFAIHFNSEIASTSSGSNSSGGDLGSSNCSNNVDRLTSAPSSSSGSNNNSNNYRLRGQIENSETGCQVITLTDSESFDTAHLKCITIKILENKWPALVKNMSNLISTYRDVDNAENCILTFLCLWENIISVKANLSIVETLPFYAQLDKFELLLNQNLSCTIYKQMLTLFNEALCYGSTLALQDLLPEETCQLAHQIVRHVKDFRILDSLPRRQPENCIGFVGFRGECISFDNNSFEHVDGVDETSDEHGSIDMDKTILQKMVLLVLKSVAVTVKEIRSDSSDSSIDSSDYDAFQDMVLIERSIRDVLKKLESFIKNTLEFHPECHFSKILIHLFDDQDDHLIEAMVCTLDVTAGISFRNNAFPELVSMLNPVLTFLEFLKMISNSSDLLLDLLVSNETCFLLYLLRFLKYIRLNWSMFVSSCHEFNLNSVTRNTTLDDAMSVLIRLRLQISRLVSKSLYPYDISPVLRLLESCESLYEGNELS